MKWCLIEHAAPGWSHKTLAPSLSDIIESCLAFMTGFSYPISAPGSLGCTWEPHVALFYIPNCLRWSSWTATVSDSLSDTWFSTRLGLSPPHVVNVRNQTKDTLQSWTRSQHQGSLKDLYFCFSRCTGFTWGTGNTSKVKPRSLYR